MNQKPLTVHVVGFDGSTCVGFDWYWHEAHADARVAELQKLHRTDPTEGDAIYRWTVDLPQSLVDRGGIDEYIYNGGTIDAPDDVPCHYTDFFTDANRVSLGA